MYLILIKVQKSLSLDMFNNQREKRKALILRANPETDHCTLSRPLLKWTDRG